MPVGTLKKLRKRSLRELGARGRQELAKTRERLVGVNSMSDRSLLSEISRESRNCSAEGSAALIFERIGKQSIEGGAATGGHPYKGFSSGSAKTGQGFFPSLAARDAICDLMETRFANEREALIDRAERAIKGQFDLLGLKNLSFGEPIDWLLEPVSGKRTDLRHWSRIDYLNPDVAGDKKITWELNRHAHFVTLGQAWFLTRDERYAQAFVAQAESWLEANPVKLGINWASSLEVSFRSIAWLWALNLFAGSPSITPGFLARMLKSLIAHGRHIETYLSHYFSPNTHLTGEALGLLYLGVSLPELTRAKEWRDTGLRILLEQLQHHVRPDGVYFEQSTYYHRYTADFYTHVLLLSRAAGIPLPRDVEHSLTLLLDHLMWITRPDGSSPLIGDDDGGRLVSFGARAKDDFRETLATGAAIFGREDWKYVAGGAAVETLWLLGPQGLARFDEVIARPPRDNSRAFDDGGYYAIRDGWQLDSSYVLIDCGPHGSIGAGHAHASALSFEFGADGKQWFVNPGTFTYTGNYSGDGRGRDWFRSTESHNTVVVDGEQQSVSAGPFSWRTTANATRHTFISTDSLDYFKGSHDGYERLADPVTHTREIFASKRDGKIEYIIIRDSFTANADHRYSLRYHFPAECSATAIDNEVIATQGDETLKVAVFGDGDIHANVEEGWVSRCYGTREAAPVALFEAEGCGPQEFVTIVFPERASAETDGSKPRNPFISTV